MSDNSWTPGPWKVTRNNRDIVADDGKTVVAYTYEADARLIAAAPEMADWISKVLADPHNGFSEAAEDRGRTLLNRIRGDETSPGPASLPLAEKREGSGEL